MCQYPTAVAPVFDRREEKVHVLTDPAVEGVSIVAKVLGQGIRDHVGVGEPRTDQTGSHTRLLAKYQARKTA